MHVDFLMSKESNSYPSQQQGEFQNGSLTARFVIEIEIIGKVGDKPVSKKSYWAVMYKSSTMPGPIAQQVIGKTFAFLNPSEINIEQVQFIGKPSPHAPIIKQDDHLKRLTRVIEARIKDGSIGKGM